MGIPLATIKKSRFAGLPAKYHSTEPGGLMPAERIGRAFNIFLIVATARRHCVREFSTNRASEGNTMFLRLLIVISLTATLVS